MGVARPLLPHGILAKASFEFTAFVGFCFPTAISGSGSNAPETSYVREQNPRKVSIAAELKRKEPPSSSPQSPKADAG